MADRVEELRQEEQELNKQVEQAAEEVAQEAKKEGLSDAEINERIQKARKEEKDKLYPQLEELRQAQKEMQDILRAEREEKEALKRAQEEKAEQQRVAKLSEAQRTQEILAKLEEQLKEEREARNKFKLELEERRREEELRVYKQRAIQAAGGEIIEGLVGGNSEAEIDASVARAKSEWKKIYEAAQQQANYRVRQGLSTANPDMEAHEEQELQRTLGQFDAERYMKDAEYREQVQAHAARLYQTGGAR